jgi:dipeptidase E
VGLIPHSLAPHYQSAHPESALIDSVVAYFMANDMPFKTLRDGEVIIDEA